MSEFYAIKNPSTRLGYINYFICLSITLKEGIYDVTTKDNK